MLLKLVCTALAWHYALGAGDELLNALGGARGGDLLSVCMAPRGADGAVAAPATERCDAALWRQRWAVARASCVARRAVAPVRALRTADGLAGKIRFVRVHPSWQPRGSAGASGAGSYDLALLTLDHPFEHIDVIANTTSVRILLENYKLWMAEIYTEYLRTAVDQGKPKYYIKHVPLFSSPLMLLLMTIVLPATGLLAVFMFVTTYTGTPLKVPPYQNIENEDEVVASWLKTEYSLGVKCYPAYGQV